MSNIVSEIKHTFENLVTLKSFEKFDKMTGKKQVETLAKMAAVSLLAGLVAANVLGLAPALCSLIAFTVGLYAFGYLTSEYGVFENAKDHGSQLLDNAVSSVKKTFK
jgi:hypothetical protein